MSRTYRRLPKEQKHFRKYYRHPKTFNERKQLEELNYDDEFQLTNRDKAKINNLPKDWDDITKSAYYEDYGFKHFHEFD